MRKIALLAVVAFAASCGSSSDPAPAGASITGTVGTASFTSASQLALVASSDSCQISLAPVSIGVSLALANVADVAGTCSQIDLNCLSNSRNLQIVIAKVHVPNAAFPTPTAPAFTTGAYQYANLANLDPAALAPDPVTGNISIFTGGVVAYGAAPTCTETAGYGIASGTLNVTAVSGSTLTGTINVTLVNSLGQAAGSLSGTFTTANICTPSNPETACQLLNGIIPAP